MSDAVKIAACMIVRDGAATVERAIASVRPHVDEVCVFDTGSTDGTLELLDDLSRRPGAPIRVERGTWRDDYGWAREQSFAIASSEWLLWLDDDDELIGGAALRRLGDLGDDVSHVYLRRDTDVSTFDVRLARAGTCRWVGRLHELLQPAGDELAFAFGRTDMILVKHPPVRGDRHDAALLAMVDGGDDSVALARYATGALWRRGDLEGAEAAMRRYLDRTHGRFDDRRHEVHLELAEIVVRRDVAAGVALIQARNAEREEWARRAAAGELAGRAALGPDVWLRFNGWRPPAAGRNEPCPCGSGRKSKRCCAGRVFVRPGEVS